MGCRASKPRRESEEPRPPEQKALKKAVQARPEPKRESHKSEEREPELEVSTAIPLRSIRKPAHGIGCPAETMDRWRRLQDRHERRRRQRKLNASGWDDDTLREVGDEMPSVDFSADYTEWYRENRDENGPPLSVPDDDDMECEN